MTWEKAILRTLEERGGSASLKEFYAVVPALVAHTNAKDAPHVIRAYLRRLKQKGLVKQAGLSLYALPSVAPKNPFFETALAERDVQKAIEKLSKNEIHGFVEGMLVELGNATDFETYTPDKHVVFNGKSLRDLCALTALPNFTYQEILASASMIDVVWLKDGFPVKTFDVEQTTNFQAALLRVYQLRYFKASFFVVASEERRAVFEKRLRMKPFSEIADSAKFVSYQDVYDAYRHAATSLNAIRKSKIFN